MLNRVLNDKFCIQFNVYLVFICRYQSNHFDHSISYDVVVQRKITAAHQKIFLNRKVATINYMYEKETNIEAVCKLKI